MHVVVYNTTVTLDVPTCCSVQCFSKLIVLLFRLGQPIRCMLDRDEDMLSSGGRHPFLGRYKVGFDSEGKCTACEIKLYNNCGITHDLSHAVSLLLVL